MNKVFLPYNGKRFDDPAFHWLCFNMKGKFKYADSRHEDDGPGSNIFFESKEDMQHFILMWGEHL